MQVLRPRSQIFWFPSLREVWSRNLLLLLLLLLLAIPYPLIWCRYCPGRVWNPTYWSSPSHLRCSGTKCGRAFQQRWWWLSAKYSPSGHVTEVTDFRPAYIPVPATETYLDSPRSWIHPLPAIQQLPVLENWTQMAFSTRKPSLLTTTVCLPKGSEHFNVSYFMSLTRFPCCTWSLYGMCILICLSSLTKS